MKTLRGDRKSPLCFCRVFDTMQTDSLRELAEQLLGDAAHFVVDVRLLPAQGATRVQVLVDGDQGISIDDCARLSRQLSAALDERGFGDDRYTLEVSTPGVDQPLRLLRQYRKNIGRTVKVVMHDKTKWKGPLLAVSDSAIVMRHTEGEGKKKTEKEVTLSLDQIEKTLVQISFK